MNSWLKTLALLVFFYLSVSTLIFAQPGDPDGDPDSGAVPLGGIEILLAAGAMFGAKKWLDIRKKN